MAGEFFEEDIKKKLVPRLIKRAYANTILRKHLKNLVTLLSRSTRLAYTPVCDCARDCRWVETHGYTGRAKYQLCSAVVTRRKRRVGEHELLLLRFSCTQRFKRLIILCGRTGGRRMIFTDSTMVVCLRRCINIVKAYLYITRALYLISTRICSVRVKYYYYLYYNNTGARATLINLSRTHMPVYRSSRVPGRNYIIVVTTSGFYDNPTWYLDRGWQRSSHEIIIVSRTVDLLKFDFEACAGTAHITVIRHA